MKLQWENGHFSKKNVRFSLGMATVCHAISLNLRKIKGLT